MQKGYKRTKSCDMKPIEGEIWKDIKGYEGLYQVSNMARVRGLDHLVKAKDGREWIQRGVRMYPSTNNVGYLYVRLVDKDKNRNIKLLHRLVAKAFVHNPDPENFDIINHKDENPKNNLPINLEWCNQKYNLNYGTFRKRQKKTYQKNKKLGLHSDNVGKPKTAVRIIDNIGNTKEFKSVKLLCDYLGCSRAAVSKVFKGGLKGIQGYRLEKIG